jgi:broad specificity phosphatase PhoE
MLRHTVTDESGEWSVFICRHGQTALNSSHALQGRHSNPPLNEIGKAQANALGVRLAQLLHGVPMVTLSHSPLNRAIETANHVAHFVRGHYPHHTQVHEMHATDDFNEVDFGKENEGKLIEIAKAAVRPTWLLWSVGDVDAQAYADAESLRHILTRFNCGIHTLFMQCAMGRMPGVVITHSGLLAIIMAAAKANGRHDGDYLSNVRKWGLNPDHLHKIDNCDINKLVFRYEIDRNAKVHLDLARVEMDNATDHLPPALLLRSASAHTIPVAPQGRLIYNPPPRYYAYNEPPPWMHPNQQVQSSSALPYSGHAYYY